MSNPESSAATGLPEEFPLTPLSSALKSQTGTRGDGTVDLAVHRGVHTARLFDDSSREIDSLFSSAGVFDLGWRGKILVRGNDRLRWLNGMVTNTVQGLPQNEGNYSFFLNNQGRIQGDGYVYRRADDLILDSSRDQVPALLRHLDHYIIMDEVELDDVSNQWTGFGLAGQQAPSILSALGLALSSIVSPTGNARFLPGSIEGVEVTIIEAHHVLVPRYEIWLRPADVLRVWEAVQAAGAKRVGLEASEALRVLEGTPLYGVDLNDRDLPQEAGQESALNFNKGCYLGQEIVERIRSRGKVHRQLRQFSLNGAPASLPFDLRSAGQPAGRITSAVSVSTAGLSGTFAIGFIREESVARKAPIEYDGGIAVPLETPPQLFLSSSQSPVPGFQSAVH
jgi:folate-binding protein YgfZ